MGEIRRIGTFFAGIKGGALRAVPVVFLGLPQDDAAAVHRHKVQLNREALAVLVIPGRPDADPEGIFSALGDMVGDESRGLGVLGLLAVCCTSTCHWSSPFR